MNEYKKLIDLVLWIVLVLGILSGIGYATMQPMYITHQTYYELCIIRCVLIAGFSAIIITMLKK